MTTVADHWGDVARAALLGLDRRPAPSPPDGVAGRLAADRAPQDPADAVLDRLALLTAVRRGALRPAPAVAPLDPAPEDPRPPCPPAAIERLRLVVEAWPRLVDEWLDLADAAAVRLDGEVVVELLARWRGDACRRARVVALTGGLAEWITALFPAELAPPARRSAGAGAPDPGVPDPLAGLPPEIRGIPAGDPRVADRLAAGLSDGSLGVRHRPALEALVCGLAPSCLLAVAASLGRAGDRPQTMGLALSLADLATVRRTMIEELSP